MIFHRELANLTLGSDLLIGKTAQDEHRNVLLSCRQSIRMQVLVEKWIHCRCEAARWRTTWQTQRLSESYLGGWAARNTRNIGRDKNAVNRKKGQLYQFLVSTSRPPFEGLTCSSTRTSIRTLLPKGAFAMEWVTPQHAEIDLNCEVSSYANAEL